MAPQVSPSWFRSLISEASKKDHAFIFLPFAFAAPYGPMSKSIRTSSEVV